MMSGEMVGSLVGLGMRREQGARWNAQHLLGHGEAECLGAATDLLIPSKLRFA